MVWSMFVETITQPRDEWHHWSSKLRFYDDPPAALVTSVAWDAGDGMVTQVNVWDTPGAISDFFMERALQLIERDGEPEHKPRRHGEPVAAYVRQ